MEEKVFTKNKTLRSGVEAKQNIAKGWLLSKTPRIYQL
jgi:hypothetical protein